jgi:hypothetical protein
MLCAGQLTLPDPAGTTPDPAGKNTDTRCFKPIQLCCTQVSHNCLYPQYCSHLHPAFLNLILNSTIVVEHKVKSSLSISQCHNHELTPSTAYTESTADTKSAASRTHDCQSSLHSQDYELTPECSFTFQCASQHDHLPAPHESTKEKITHPQSHSCELTN